MTTTTEAIDLMTGTLNALDNVIDLTPDTLRERLAAFERYRTERLQHRALALELEMEPDPITGGWAVRSPRRPGYVEIVTDAGCTCAEYAVLQSCPHAALVANETDASLA